MLWIYQSINHSVCIALNHIQKTQQRSLQNQRNKEPTGPPEKARWPEKPFLELAKATLICPKSKTGQSILIFLLYSITNQLPCMKMHPNMSIVTVKDNGRCWWSSDKKLTQFSHWENYKKCCSILGNVFTVLVTWVSQEVSQALQQVAQVAASHRLSLLCSSIK